MGLISFKFGAVGRIPQSFVLALTDDKDFPVTPYSGTKSIVISTVSWVGGKNPFLGWAYVGASALLALLAIAGTVRHCLKPRKSPADVIWLQIMRITSLGRLGDMSQLSWNQPSGR